MCCNYGLSASKTDPFFTFSSTIPTPCAQIRLDPLPRIFFPSHSSSLHGLKSRVGCRPGSGSFSTKSMLKDSLSVAEPCSFYELLGIPETGTPLEVKQAYKQLARKYHPDVSPPDRVKENTQRFIRVQEAYETLSDPDRRALYDRYMAKGLHHAFTARKRHQDYDAQMERKAEWTRNWQSQLEEIQRRSMYKDAHSMSWGAQMRRKKRESSSTS